MKAKWVSIKKLNTHTMKTETVARAVLREDGTSYIQGDGLIAREISRGVPAFGTFKILKLNTDGEAFLDNLELAYRNFQTGKASPVRKGDDDKIQTKAA
ncbi:hypothetical protein KJ611_04390 [Patescibacteria group bacterium]|nr:hypothetical protein [Patescibacteria group bacterium]MBU1705786.1 hypothetical protein [Patescibacteria group bacterium]